MYKSIGVVSIGLDNLKYASGSLALERSGNNSGNMLFTEAVYRQIEGTKHIGFNFNPDVVRNEFDSIMIPASNWVNWKQDWGWLADLLEQTNLPICVIGLGSQMDGRSLSEVPEGTVRLLNILSERGSSLGVRGEFTAQIINDLGVKNISVLGCPSVFSDGRVPEIRPLEKKEDFRLAFGPTRYGFGKEDFENVKHREMYQYAIKYASSIYYQSESFEIAFLNREDVGANKEKAVEYYGLNDFSDLSKKLLEKGKFHSSLAHWITDVKKEDCYIGTRIHGVVSSTLAGTPSLLITHDKRTEELASYMGVPNISILDFNIKNLSDFGWLSGNINIQNFMDISKLNIEVLHEFYASHNLMFNRF